MTTGGVMSRPQETRDILQLSMAETELSYRADVADDARNPVTAIRYVFRRVDALEGKREKQMH